MIYISAGVAIIGVLGYKYFIKRVPASCIGNQHPSLMPSGTEFCSLRYQA